MKMKMRMRMMYKEEEKRFWKILKEERKYLPSKWHWKIYIFIDKVADWFKNVDCKLCGKCEAKHRDKFNSNLLEWNQKKRKSKT